MTSPTTYQMRSNLIEFAKLQAAAENRPFDSDDLAWIEQQLSELLAKDAKAESSLCPKTE